MTTLDSFWTGAAAVTSGGVPPRKAAKPFIKWAGGKSSLSARIVELFGTAPFRRYYEPFLGGGAVYFRLQPSRSVLSDTNPELINAYSQVRKNVEALITALGSLAVGHSKDQYYQLRRRPPEEPVARAAWFVYLNKTCFNGLWRVNSVGEFNVPMGSYANPRILDADGLRAASSALQSARLKVDSFEEVLTRGSDQPRDGDAVYMDPPYDPLSRTSSFTSYTKEGFELDDQEELASVCVRLDERGVRFVLSDSDTPRIRKLYRNSAFTVERVRMGRAINSDPAGRGSIPELLIRNF